jgi:hypothetical protein
LRGHGLLRGKETGAEQGAVRTEHQCGGKAAPVGYSTRRHDNHGIVALADGVDNRWYEGRVVDHRKRA